MSAGTIARKIGIPFALVVAGLAFSLLVLEIGLRIVGYDRMGFFAEGRALILRKSDDPRRVYELTPDTSGLAWHTNVRINSEGLRGREYPFQRTGAPRVVVVGDSITFGNGVSESERFTDQLETLLGDRLGRPVEVVNLGVGGYDTLQEVATLEDVGLRFRPDVVVVAYCVNDLIDDSPNLDYIQDLEHASSTLYRLRVAQLLRVMVDRLQLIRRFELENEDEHFASTHRGEIAPVSGDHELARLQTRLEERVKADPHPDFRLQWYLSDAHLGKVVFALAELRKVAQEHGFPVVVAIIPYLGKKDGYDVVYRMVAHMAREQGFEPVVLESQLAKAGLESLRRWSRDGIHPNARGHRLIAEALVSPLVSKLAERSARGGSGAAPVSAHLRPR